VVSTVNPASRTVFVRAPRSESSLTRRCSHRDAHPVLSFRRGVRSVQQMEPARARGDGLRQVAPQKLSVRISLCLSCSVWPGVRRGR